MESTYDIYYTPVVAHGLSFPTEYLAEVAKAGYSPSTHEPLQRYASEDFANGFTAWWAFKRTGDDEMEVTDALDASEDTLNKALDFPDLDDPRSNTLDHQELPTFTYSATPFPGMPDEPATFLSEQETLATFDTSTSAIPLPGGLQDDIEVLSERKEEAVKLLYKAVCSMPVRLDTLNASQDQRPQDVRTEKVNEMVIHLSLFSDDVTHRKLSAVAELLYRDIIKLHSVGYTVNMPAKYRRSDKHLTAVQRLEALMQYLTDMKGLVSKCLVDGLEGIAEVVAFPKTFFELCLTGEVTDSGDEEESSDIDEVNEQEMTGAGAAITAGTAAHAGNSSSTPAVPTSPPSTRRPRRRLRPKIPSNFL